MKTIRQAEKVSRAGYGKSSTSFLCSDTRKILERKKCKIKNRAHDFECYGSSCNV